MGGRVPLKGGHGFVLEGHSGYDWEVCLAVDVEGFSAKESGAIGLSGGLDDGPAQFNGVGAKIEVAPIDGMAARMAVPIYAVVVGGRQEVFAVVYRNIDARVFSESKDSGNASGNGDPAVGMKGYVGATSIIENQIHVAKLKKE